MTGPRSRVSRRGVVAPGVTAAALLIAAAAVLLRPARAAPPGTDDGIGVQYVAVASPERGVPYVAVQQPARRPGCDGCHAERELLRQQAGSMSRADALLVPHAVVAASAHGGMTCAECHAGFDRFPHPARETGTASCASCHAPADSAWHDGIHARADDPVTCVQCHGTHDVAAAATLRTDEGAAVANAPCIDCHRGERLERHTPHSNTVACAACHASHDVRPVDDPASWLAPARQRGTCGSCHDSVAAVWRTDVHGARNGTAPSDQSRADVVACTSCHYGHRMVAPGDSAFATDAVARCSACHEHAARTFFGSYHGKATALGSRVSAACHDCHGAHDILPDTAAASRVAAANLVDTCSACHAYARPAFVRYDAHPDPFNRARNPWIFYSFWFMNGLLVFVLVVFGAHTVLWWIRILLDRRRGHGHGAHGESA